MAAATAGVGFGFIRWLYGSRNPWRAVFYGFLIWVLFVFPARVIHILDRGFDFEGDLTATIRWFVFILLGALTMAIMNWWQLRAYR